MKKRLLISSVLMSAVLACALGTGTYAWYSATSQAGVSAEKSQQIATTNPNIELGSVTLSATIAEVSDSELHLATIENGAYKNYYLNSGKNKVAYTLKEGQVSSKAYKVTITVSQEQVDLVAGSEVEISVAGENDRATYWISSTALTDDVVWDEDCVDSLSFTLENSAKSYDYWVAVYVEGDNLSSGVQTPDATDLTVDFTVTVG